MPNRRASRTIREPRWSTSGASTRRRFRSGGLAWSILAIRQKKLNTSSTGREKVIDVSNPGLMERATQIVQFRPDIVVSAAGAPFTQQGGIFDQQGVCSEDGAILRPQFIADGLLVLARVLSGGAQGLMKPLQFVV